MDFKEGLLGNPKDGMGSGEKKTPEGKYNTGAEKNPIPLNLTTENPEKAAELKKILIETGFLAQEINDEIKNTDPKSWSWDKFKNVVKKAMTVEKVTLMLGIALGMTLIALGVNEWSEGIMGSESYGTTNTPAALKTIAGVMTMILSAIVPGVVKMEVPEKRKN